MKKSIVPFIFAIFVFCISFSSSARAGAESGKNNGKEVFLKYKCDNCHAVSTAGIVPKIKSKAPDLENVMSRHQSDWVRKFIRQNEVHVSCPKVDPSLDGKLHPVKFTGSQDEEDALISWLEKQKSK